VSRHLFAFKANKVPLYNRKCKLPSKRKNVGFLLQIKTNTGRVNKVSQKATLNICRIL